MKKIKIYVIILSMLLTCSCTKIKNSIDGERFVKSMQDLQYEVSSVKDIPDYAKNAYIVNDVISLYFIEGTKKYDIEGIFIDECSNVLSQVKKDYKKKTAGGDNWTKLTVWDDEVYYYVIWVDKTYIYAKTTIDNKDKLNEVMNTLGY